MLAVLLVAALASTFALVVVVAVQSSQLVGAADTAGWRAAAARARAVTEACGAIRWRPATADGSVTGGLPGQRESWAAEWIAAPPSATSPWVRRRIRVVATHGFAVRRDDLLVELRAEAWATGVTCSSDAEFRAPFVVDGSGVYVGGSVRGREEVQFPLGAVGTTLAGEPADGARGDEVPAAAVHAGAGIFAGGLEIHAPESPPDAFPSDGDPHTAAAPPAAWVAAPSAEFLAAAEVRAEEPGPALVGRVLTLDAVSEATSDELAAGRCLLLPAGDEVTIEGVLPAAAGPLLVVVQGDAVVGQPGTRVELNGGLVVCGRLRLRGELRLQGPLHAGSLVVEAPAFIALGPVWRERLLPGAARPVIVEAGA